MLRSRPATLESSVASKKIPFSYANRTALDGHIITFSCDIVAGDTLPTNTISDYWWDLADRPVLSQETATSEVTKLRPENHTIPEEAAVPEQARIPLACIAPIVLAHPLLTNTYLSPAAAYTLLSARSTSYI